MKSPSPEPEIGYILKKFPRISETFIAREIYVLEQMGLSLHVFSLMGEETSKHHDIVGRIKSGITYLPVMTSLSDSSFPLWLTRNLPAYIGAHVTLAWLRPAPYFSALLAALRMSFRYRRGAILKVNKKILKQFIQAGSIALNVLESGRIRHLHGHFCHDPATVTLFASRIAGVPFSFSAHAKDIYQRDLNPGDLLVLKMSEASFVVTCSKAGQQHLKNMFPDKKIIHAIYHGLDTEFFAPARRQESLNGRPPLILSVGRFVGKKGFPFLIEACRILKDRGHAFHCLIVGDDRGDQLPLIERLIAECDLGDEITIRKALTQEELREVYREATVFALPCQIADNGDRDGIPNVLMEAMSTGIPVISCDVSGIPELVEHGVDGWLVPQRDSEALADGLQTLLSNPDLRRQLGTRSREKICKSFDAWKTTAQLRELFLSTLNGTAEAVSQEITARPSRNQFNLSAET